MEQICSKNCQINLGDRELSCATSGLLTSMEMSGPTLRAGEGITIIQSITQKCERSAQMTLCLCWEREHGWRTSLPALFVSAQHQLCDVGHKNIVFWRRVVN